MASADEDMAKRGFLCTAGGNVNWHRHYGRKEYRGSLRDKRQNLIMWPSNSIPAHLSKGSTSTSLSMRATATVTAAQQPRLRRDPSVPRLGGARGRGGVCTQGVTQSLKQNAATRDHMDGMRASC